MLVAGDVSHRLEIEIRFRVPEGTACRAADYISSRWDFCGGCAIIPVTYVTGY